MSRNLGQAAEETYRKAQKTTRCKLFRRAPFNRKKHKKKPEGRWRLLVMDVIEYAKTMVLVNFQRLGLDETYSWGHIARHNVPPS